MDSAITVLLILFNIFSAVDTVQTIYLIETYGIEGERNPVAKFIYAKTSYPGLIGFKVAQSYFITKFILNNKEKRPTFCFYFTLSITASQGTVCALNFHYNF